MRSLAPAVLLLICCAANAGLVGNGKLTAVVDPFGRLTACRWPGPAMNNQASAKGTCWALETPDGLTEFDETKWQASAGSPAVPGIDFIRLDSKDGFASATCETFISPDKDVLIARFMFVGGDAQLVWQPRMRPKSILVPEMAGLDEILPSNSLPPVFHKPSGRAYVLSPDATSGGAKSPDEAEGVWIVYGGRGGDFNGSVSEPAFRFHRSSKDEALTAEIIVAFGKTKTEAEAGFGAAASTSFEQLRNEVVTRWTPFAGAGGDDLATLTMSIDRQTGGFCRDAGGVDGDAVCYARDAAWASLALDLTGRAEAAEQVLLFAASTVRREQERSRPRGSLPIACYGDGTEALPHLELDADAPAFLLGAVWRHAQAVADEQRRKQFLSGTWDAAVLMADFLTNWTDGRNREPLYTFDADAGRDVQGPERLLTTYMGIDAALRIANALGQPEREEWARRKVELDALIRFQLIDREKGEWKGPILPLWHDMMAQDWSKRGYTLPPWDAAVEEMLKVQTPETLAGAALVWRGDPKHARAAMPESPAQNGLQAAQRLIALLY